jgi:CRISP-associated protein Cas1
LRRRIRHVHFRNATFGTIGMKKILEIPIDKEATNSSASRIVDDSNWAVRSGMWRDRVEKASARRTKRAKAYPALILAGHGVSLRIRGGALEIQNGLTHYPQSRETYLFFRRDADLPERIILLDGTGSVSFDVLSWLAEQKVSLIRIDWKGDIVCVSGTSGYSANPHRVRWQLETRDNPEQRNEFCRSLIAHKIEASIITLEKSIRRSDEIRLCGIDPARRKSAGNHYRIARIGG